MSIENDRTFKVFWLDNRGDVHYAGLLHSYRFVGNTLEVTLDKMAEITKVSEHGWRPTAWYKRGFTFTPFKGCRVKTNESDRIVVVTNEGDTITLSNRESDLKTIDSLGDDGPRITSHI